MKQIMLLLICAIATISCQKKGPKDEKNSLKSLIELNLGRKLVLPESLETLRPFSDYISDSIELVNSEFKIYSRVNVSCVTCIEEVELWGNLINEFNKYRIPVILICHSQDEFELFQYICEEGNLKKFPYPFFLDKNKEFVKLNKFMSESQHLETVLTDKKNNILLMGNPIYSKEIKDMYINEIQKRTNI